MSFSIKNNDDRPAYVVDLKDNFGLVNEAPIDLTNAVSVTFKMRPTGTTGAPKVSRGMTIVDAINGRVQYVWLVGDTDTPGTYDVEFEIAWNDGGIETVPNGDYLTVIVTDDLDD